MLIVGIGDKMLTRTLHSLDRDGRVSRRAHPVVPPRVEYRLTGLGLTLDAPPVPDPAVASTARSAVRGRRRHPGAGPYWR